jgi:hypothetical protein
VSKASTRSSRGRVRAVILVFALLIAVSGPVDAVETPSVSGIVTDLVGQVLSGVELLWVRQPATGLKPAATVVTDAFGRFEIQKLIPGKYRVAALKHGYRTIIGQIDTSLQASLNLVMQPAGSALPAPQADDPGWALRLPRRGMLNELDPSAVAEATTAPAAPLTVKLEQMFSATAGVIEPETSDTHVRPSETMLEMTSSFNDRSSLRVRGQREQISGRAESAAGGEASQSDETVNLDFAYATSDDSELELSASFKQTDYELAGVEVAGNALRQQQETQAYGARWTRRFDEQSTLTVGVRYLDTGIERPSTDPLGRLERTAGADGTFQTTLGQRHTLSAEMHAEVFEQPVDRGLPPGLGQIPSDPHWSVRGEIQDTWVIRAPWSLIYGAGYKQALLGDRSAMLVPRLGVGYAADAFRVRSVFSYHAVDSGDERGRAYEPGGFRPRDRVGYAADAEFPVARGILLSLATSFEPAQMDHFGYGFGSAMQGDHPLFLTGGNSSLREHRLKLVERRGSSRTYFEIADGECSGSATPMMPFELPTGIGLDRVVRFRTGRVGVHLEHIGTDLRVEYQLIDSARNISGEFKDEAVQESVEFRLRQDVPAESWPGFWQLLLALRMGSVSSEEFESAREYAGGESLDALNRRLSAGVSVLF